MKHIVFAIGSLHGGGAERVVSVWASALAEKGYPVSIIIYARHENEGLFYARPLRLGNGIYVRGMVSCGGDLH